MGWDFFNSSGSTKTTETVVSNAPSWFTVSAFTATLTAATTTNEFYIRPDGTEATGAAPNALAVIPFDTDQISSSTDVEVRFLGLAIGTNSAFTANTLSLKLRNVNAFGSGGTTGLVTATTTGQYIPSGFTVSINTPFVTTPAVISTGTHPLYVLHGQWNATLSHDVRFSVAIQARTVQS